MLKKQGQGFSKAETVRHLRDKFGISTSAGYYHFETMDKWKGQYFDFSNAKEFQYQILNRFNHVYREASFQLQHAKDDSNRIGYMRVMIEANNKLAEYGLPDNVAQLQKGDSKITIRWKDQEPDSLNETLRQYEQMLVDAAELNVESQRAEQYDFSNLTGDEKKTLDDASEIFWKHHKRAVESSRSELH